MLFYGDKPLNMKVWSPLFSVIPSLFFFLVSCGNEVQDANKATVSSPEYALVIHGGAGSVTREGLSEEKDERYRSILEGVLKAGQEVLENDGSALEAVEKVIAMMEDDTLFNAGRGAVLTYDETVSLDASIMDGQTMQAGAVAGINRVRHPITLARYVMTSSPHAMLSGEGAHDFAVDMNLELVSDTFFKTSSKVRRVREIKMREKESGYVPERADWKYGTVGAVALDKSGQIAAGTSTGGMSNKRWGRIGDSPIIGAGTYADSKVAGVSCTGHGEFFIRYTVAYDLIAKMKYGGLTLEDAADQIINDELMKVNGAGGLIALDRQGNVSMPFNTNGMFRGYIKPNDMKIAIYQDE